MDPDTEVTIHRRLVLFNIMTSKPIAGTKRKVKPSKLAARKKAKTAHLSVDQLPWKSVARPREANASGAFDGMLELEEVSDVEVVYEETEGGKIVKFKVRHISTTS